jgi:hypothetical protein
MAFLPSPIGGFVGQQDVVVGASATKRPFGTSVLAVTITVATGTTGVVRKVSLTWRGARAIGAGR